MKIIHVVESFWAGPVSFLNDLTSGLSDCQHIIVHGNTRIDFEAHKNFSVNVSFITWKHVAREIHLIKDVLAFIDLIKILKNQPFDIIHLHSSKAGFLGRLATRVLGYHNVIYTPHCAAFIRKDIGHLRKLLFILLEKLGSWANGIVAACSKSEAQEFKKYGIKSICIPNGVKNLHFKPLPDLHILKVVNVGRICRQKNPELFNSIAEKFISDAAVRFIWIGGGDMENTLSSKNILVTGWKERVEAVELLKQSHIYLSTSLWEGLSLSCLEAMSIGRPLVLKKCVGNIDLVKFNVNGILFDDVSEAVAAIKDLKMNFKKIEEFSSNSSSIFKNEFDIHFMIEKYHQLYKKLI